MRRLALVGAFVLLLSAACKASVGNGSSGAATGNGFGCYLEPYLATTSVGNVGDTPYLPSYLNAATTSLVNFDGTSGAAGGPGSGWTTNSSPLDPCSLPTVYLTYSQAASSVSPFFPRMTIVNLATGATQTAQLASDTNRTSNQGHDQPGVIGDLPGALALIGYGGQSTAATAPPSWQNTTLLGTGLGMMPFKRGNCLGGGSTCWDNASNEFFAPGPGISEPSLASGAQTQGNAELVCGQNQPNTSISLAGAPGCYTLRVTNGGTDLCFDVVYSGTNYACMPDTTATTGAAWATACPGSTSCNGLMEITKSPHSSNYYYFTFTGAATATGGTGTVNCPQSGTASFTINANDTVATLANSAAAAMRTSCSTTSYSYTSSVGEPSAIPANSVLVQFKSTKTYSTLTNPVANGFTCSACSAGPATSANVASYTTSGSKHFLWGGPNPGIPSSYKYVYFGDVQFETTPFGTAAAANYNNNGAYMIYLMYSSGPNANGVWTWCDGSGNNCSTTQPGTGVNPPQFLGAGPGGSCSAGAYCSEPDTPTIGTNNFVTSNATITQGQTPYILPPPASYAAGMLPFCYDYGTTGQDSCTANNTQVPVVSQEVTWWYGGFQWIAFPQYLNTGETRIAVLQLSPQNWPSAIVATYDLVPESVAYQQVLTLQPVVTSSGVSLYAFGGFAAKFLTNTSGSGLYGVKFVWNGSGWSSATATSLGTAGLGSSNYGSTPCSGNGDPLHAAALFMCYTSAAAYPSNPVNFYYFNN